ncbi:DUF1592 domain-containing protein [Prosthecobacter sp. SYSU 5D2]|uniref:DUF1592 domain-containing protein n=1 Tax=Prosthecobacter sp. SYSU 5D2 TaxID=3134134 RepID=UPI0031FE783F
MTLSVRLIVLASFAASFHAGAAPDWKTVQPALAETCYDCHNGKKTKGGVDLERLDKDPSVENEYALWEKVRHVIASGEMPPEDETQLLAEEKKSLIAWADASMDAVATANAGDPGAVTLRRLTNAEYDYTIRDLTGVDYGLAKEFQPDGGGGEGFANTGDTLFVNPSQLDKYLAAARKLADHATILPGTGVTFHPQRIGMRGNAQVKSQAQQALYVWYQKMSGPHLPTYDRELREDEYLLACWKWKHKDLTGAASLDQLAKEAKLSAPFLHNWWNLLNDTKTQSRFLDLTKVPWRKLPPPDAAKPHEVPPQVLAGVKAIQVQRHSWNHPDKPGSGTQRRQQDADGIRTYGGSRVLTQGAREFHVVLGDIGDGNGGDYVTFTGLTFRKKGGKNYEYAPFMRQQRAGDQKLLKDIESGKPAPKGITADLLKKRIGQAEKALSWFGKDPLGKNGIAENVLAAKAPLIITLPLPEDTVEVFGAGRLDMRSPEVDLATVQWTLRVGTPPNPKDIIPGVLTVWKRNTDAHRKTMADFSRMKAAFPDMLERRLEEVARNAYSDKPGPGVYYFSDDQLKSIIPAAEAKRLDQMKTDWNFLVRDTLKKEQAAQYDEFMRQHLHRFASQAWRRPTTQAERTQLSKLYHDGLTKGMDRESAAREVVTLILVSPNFLYKTEGFTSTAGTLARQNEVQKTPSSTKPTEVSQRSADTPVRSAAGQTISLSENPTEVSLNAWELASRLSYFLWSSQPDWQLRKAATDGTLLQPEVLTTQVKRMLKDPKAEALAKEFAGQWLEFKGFDKHAAVDDKKFPEFTPELRRDLDRETTLFFTSLIREDRPVQEIIGADYTYLNERLAKHYGVPNVKGEEFRKVSVSAQHRGGLLGQGSLLTKTSRSHRTSPVLRGNWLLQAVLGTPVPPPPADVPELKEHGPRPTTVREMLEQHRASKSCSGCHDRIDPLGFALEGFDAIGRYREKDESGLPLDTSGQVKGGAKFVGFEGLRDYLKTQDDQLTRHFSRKLIGFALGRQLLPTDKFLMQEIKTGLSKNEGRFSAAVLAIVHSRQFQNKRL